MSGSAPEPAGKWQVILHNTRGCGANGLFCVETRFMKFLILSAAALLMAVPAAGQAKPSLRDVPEIENALFSVAIADEVRDYCTDIRGRVLKAINVLQRAKRHANSLGYSDTEIRAYVKSDAEKARMRAKGERFLAQNGVQYDKPETFCAFGRAEIEKNSAIGALLRAK